MFESDDLPLMIKFHSDMRKANHDGRKCCTTRARLIGSAGELFADILEPEIIYRIIRVDFIPLSMVKELFYDVEGFDSPEAFEEFWCKLYRCEFDNDRFFYLHWYAMVLNKNGKCQSSGVDSDD
jgi:hypothetical protein